MPATKKSRKILGVNFYTGDLPTLLDLTSDGGLVVVPSAPVLVELPEDKAHREALQQSDVAIVDSGLLVLLWLATKGKKLERISGLRFIRSLIDHPEFRAEGATFWVMPSEQDLKVNVSWLAKNGISVATTNSYVAPHYPKKGYLQDEVLADLIERSQARFVILNLGGGIQERLGHYLRDRLNYRPAIICTGAAIAFLSGQQAAIPGWADKAMLGWLLRCISAPGKFVPRYVKAGRLVAMVLRHGTESPVRKASARRPGKAHGHGAEPSD